MVKKKTASKPAKKKAAARKTVKKAVKKIVKKKSAVKKAVKRIVKKKAMAKKAAAKKVAPPKPKVKSPFNKTELVKIREVLIKKKAEILEELMQLKGQSLNKSLKDASGDLSGYSFHMADMATDLYDREFSLGLAEGERELLFALDDAIKRVDEGVYGVCEDCKGKIKKQRLKVMPEAILCIKCREKEERLNSK